MHTWTTFAHTKRYPFDSTQVAAQWMHLHAMDLEPLPDNPQVLAAWALFHSGHFQQAHRMGLQAGEAGVVVANKAACSYAQFLEPSEQMRQSIFLQVSERTAQFLASTLDNANAHYLYAHALGRYSESMSVAKSLSEGLGDKVLAALVTTLKIHPTHSDALVAMAAFHADVIDKVGPLIGNLTYRVKKATSVKLFEQALALTPHSANAMMKYADALVILFGEARMDEATALYERAAALTPMDATQHMEIELAKNELQN